MKSEINNKVIPRGINLIEKINLVFVILLTMFFIAGLFQPEINVRELLQTATIVCICFFIFYGIKNTKRWLVLLVLITSAMFLITSIINFLSFKPLTGEELIAKILFLLFSLFFAYEIVIFSRSNVKAYFGERGISLFV